MFDQLLVLIERTAGTTGGNSKVLHSRIQKGKLMYKMQ
jgi:hypothetical protein